MNLRNRILQADPSLCVADIVTYDSVSKLPRYISAAFLKMRIDWINNRVWGLSFNIGDPSVKLGHLKGHHIGTHYESLDMGLTEEMATGIMTAHLRGVLFHELGHAVLTKILESHKNKADAIKRDLASIALLDGPVSTYTGHNPDSMSGFDLVHEMFAEAFKFWMLETNQTSIRDKYPSWFAFMDIYVKLL